MKIHEYQAKQVLAIYAIPVPRGRVAETPSGAASTAQEPGPRVVVKTQVHVGGRGKAGGIRLADTPEQAAETAEAILSEPLNGLRVDRVLVEPALDIAAEYDVGGVPDRTTRKHAVIMSSM